MPELRKIADECELKEILGSAQAHGAELGGERVASWGDVATFGFYPGKNLVLMAMLEQ